ncbi:MAG: hypothetical protein AAF700_12370 [Pseudomonadota bacterium]
MANDSFESRLNRISSGGGTAQPALAATSAGQEPPRISLSGRGRPPTRVSPFLIVGLFGFGLATFVALTLTNKITGFYGVLTGSHELTVADQALKVDDAVPPPTDGVVLPIEALPPAPDGWVRVTQKDALGGNLVETVAQNWPSDAEALTEHSGYRRLQQFASLYGKEDVETRMSANRKSSALYMSKTGSYVNVSMIYRAKDRSLGAAGDARAWADQLEFEAYQTLQKGQEVERVALADVIVINATRAVGQHPLEQPLSLDTSSAVKMKLRAGLTPRALLSMQGKASADELAALIAGIDLSLLP